MNERWLQAWADLPGNLSNHLRITVIPLVTAILIGLPLALRLARRPRLRFLVLTLIGVVQTIPGLALLALMVPVFAAIREPLRAATGIEIGALGFFPAVTALTLYSLLPIVRNTITGLLSVNPATVEAARGLGMSDAQLLTRVEVPLAMPVILAGIRTATVWVVGTATLATPVGQRCLGNYIFSGLQTRNWVAVLFGCVAAALLAILLDTLLATLERALADRRPRMALFSIGCLLLTILGGLFAPWLARTRSSDDAVTVIVGSKTFTEQYILARLMAKVLEDAGYRVEIVSGLGSNFGLDALAEGGLDVFVDYTGTIWANSMQRQGSAPRAVVLNEVTDWLRAERRIENLGSLGFENAYALAMRRDVAESLGVRSLRDLARVAPQLQFGADYEFLQRPEWKALQDQYGLTFSNARAFDPSFLYDAVHRREVDVISAYTTDGRIETLDLVVLTDPEQAIPPYDAVLLLSARAAQVPGLQDALTPLLGSISNETMRRANARADSGPDSPSVSMVAEELRRQIEVGPAVEKHSMTN